VTVLLILSKIGATVFANACGPCIGMWDREGLIKKSETLSFTLSTVTFLNVGNQTHMAFVGSPELVTAIAIAEI
jgi:aconitate hydratase